MKNEAMVYEMNELDLDEVSGGCAFPKKPHPHHPVLRPKKVIKWMRVGLLRIPVVVTIWA